MKLALYQGHSPAGDRSDALARIGAVLTAAAAAGARMAVFPELFLPGYNHPDMPAATAEAERAALAPLVRAVGCGLAFGFAEAAGDARFNSALALGRDGSLLCHYRKVQLYGPREKRLFQPGDRIPTFDLDGRRVALLICYDIEFAPHVAALAASGVTLILVPTANMMPFTHVGRVTVPAMAANHAVTIAYANYCGEEGDLTYAGESCVCAADGAFLARAGQAETLLIVDTGAPIDPARLSTQGADFRPVPVT